MTERHAVVTTDLVESWKVAHALSTAIEDALHTICKRLDCGADCDVRITQLSTTRIRRDGERFQFAVTVVGEAVYTSEYVRRVHGTRKRTVDDGVGAPPL